MVILLLKINIGETSYSDLEDVLMEWNSFPQVKHIILNIPELGNIPLVNSEPKCWKLLRKWIEQTKD